MEDNIEKEKEVKTQLFCAFIGLLTDGVYALGHGVFCLWEGWFPAMLLQN